MFKFPSKPQSVSEILNKSYQLYRVSLSKAFPLALLLMLISTLEQYSHTLLGQPPGTRGFGIVSIIIMLIMMAISAFFVAAIMYRIHAVATKGDTNLMTALHVAREKFLIVFTAMIIVLIPTTVGFMLFILPGLLLATLFIMYLPLILFENKQAFDSVKTSVQMVWKNFWRVFSVIVLPIATTMIVLIAFTYLIGRHNYLGQMLINLIVLSLFVPFFNSVILVQYNDIKIRGSK